MVCIYCKEDKASDHFNREHVLPESFGGFRDTLVLHQEVCCECNDYFGKELDIALARSSSEGLERYSWQIRPAAQVHRFRYGDVQIRLDAPGTDWDKALVRKIPTQVLGESRIELIPQAVFSEEGGGLRHVPLWELRRGAWRSDQTLDLASGIRILAPADLYDEVVAALVEHGVDFRAQAELPVPQHEDGEIDVLHAFALTPTLRRAVAKVAFNHLARTNGADVALRSEFDPIRQYVRYAAPAELPVVSIVPTTRLGLAREDGQVPVVHCVTLERDGSESTLLAHLTLFHWVVYQVVLLADVPADLEVAGSGHLFTLADMTCRELVRRPNTWVRDDGQTS